MRFFIVAALTVALLGAAPDASPSPAVTIAPATSQADAIKLAHDRIDTMLRTGHADPAWFSASFLAQVPASKIDEISAQLTKALGAYQSVEFTPTRFLAHFAKGTDDILIRLDDDQKIETLFFKPPVMTTSSLDDALGAMRTPTGTLSYVILEGGRSQAAFNASEPLAVGSAFKLAVLNALQDEIAHGQRHWNDVVPLRAFWKSLPSGILRTWPDGTPLTLATYAAEMISISDNSAADAMVRLVGAEALAPYAAQNAPFFTTREMFVLKSSEGGVLRREYMSQQTPAARAAILKRVDAMPLPRLEQLHTAPDLAIEWHYSVRQLCGLMQRVANLPLMSINPGVANPSEFRHVAYKGGSDFGAINMTTMVTTKRGHTVCFSATLNESSKAVDETAFALSYSAAVRRLANM